MALNKAFGNHDSKKIALYGLSTETERELPWLAEKYVIVGLLDGFKTEGKIYGYPIISLDKAIEKGAKLIIVVARPGSCKAITRRIGDICKENNVELYDIRGKNLLQEARVTYDFKEVKGYTKAELVEQMKQADVISFDLFDTLIVRNVLSDMDVFELVAARLNRQGIEISDFVSRRIGAEKKLSKGKAPGLKTIYEEVLSEISVDNITSEQLAEWEYEIDISLVMPRKDMLNLISIAKRMKKQVYVTSESYYGCNQIEQILISCGISGIDKIFISCEYNTGKTSGLYEKVIEAAGSKNILHIGDDIVADIEAAKRSGLNTFQIYSISELLDAVGGLNLSTGYDNISDKIRVGMFAANIFNSPFQFEDEEMKIHVDDASDLGYLFCAPMIFDFAYWFGQQTEKLNISNILFCARDGYLFQRIYSKIYPESRSDYFLTSRTSSIRAGVLDKTDIDYIDSMKFSGSLEDNLKTRFGIDAKCIAKSDIAQDERGLGRYSKAIIEIAELKRRNNKKYIDSLLLNDGAVALFDFVAKGTSQMYIQRLMSNEIYGLYFLQLEPEFMKDKGLKILPFYTEEEREDSAVFDNYYILETLLTSPDPSVDEFDENGKPVYSSETRSDKDIACFMRAQEGIIKYVEEYLRLCPYNEIKINKKLDEALLILVHNIEIRDKDFFELTIEDPFFNRMTDITDVL